MMNIILFMPQHIVKNPRTAILSMRGVQMKKIIILTTILSMALALGCSQSIYAQQNTGPAAVILNNYSPRNWQAGAVPRADIDTIVQAGVRAPSAGNRQPWQFTVVIQDQSTIRELVSRDYVDGTVLIVVSAQGDGKTNGVQILDCALAAQSMYLAAQALGYGSKIYTGPINTLNSNFKTRLGLPSGHNAVAFVRIGRVQGDRLDAVSGASERKAKDAVVTYK